MAKMMNFKSGVKHHQPTVRKLVIQVVKKISLQDCGLLLTTLMMKLSFIYLQNKSDFFLWTAYGWPVPNMQIRSVPQPSSSSLEASCSNKWKPGKIFLMARLNYLVDTDLKNDCLLLNLKYFPFNIEALFLEPALIFENTPQDQHIF